MGTFIGIDPGKHSYALAEGDEEKVYFVEVYDSGAPPLRWAETCYIEVPQVYRVSKQKGDPNDLVDVALTAGYVSAFFSGPQFIRPRKWKGTVKKEVMTRRILSKLTDEELKVLGPLAKDHNVVDAVGIVLWAQGRLKK